MTRIFMTGFEQAHNGVFSGPGGTISSAQARTGNYSLQFGYATHTLPAAIQEIYYRLGLQRTGGGGLGIFNVFWDSAVGVQFTVAVNISTGFIEVYRGYFATLLDTGNIIVPLNAWQCIEVYLKIADADGRCIVKQDGVTSIDFTGDTKATANANVLIMSFGSPHATNKLSGFFDDIAINDVNGVVNNSWPGQGGIYGLVPNGAGNYAQWTPSAGANYECVDEAPPSDADYVADSVTNNKDSYAMSPTPGPGTIAALCWWARAKIEVAGDKDLKRLFRIAAADYVGSAIALDVSYLYKSEIHETSPATAVAWTVDEVDGMEAGEQVG